MHLLDYVSFIEILNKYDSEYLMSQPCHIRIDRTLVIFAGQQYMLQIRVGNKVIPRKHKLYDPL